MNSILRRAQAVFTAAVCAFSLASAVYADTGDSEVHISTAEELHEFADNCRIDSYSRGRTFVLDNDIMLTESDFQPVPVFAGVFRGNGHRIGGVVITSCRQTSGFFRCVEQGGRVHDLVVGGSMHFTDDSGKCGGIAGVNRGTITGCTYEGEIYAKNTAGGIAGENADTGLIAACTSSGSITAEHFSGGIAGRNSGNIINCTNQGGINTDALDINVNVYSFNTEEFSISSVQSAETIAAVSDIGGIAGFSDGMISGCDNTADVGYKHTGYNVGGICGRQTGYINACTNSGNVNGRKDIGGIVGQQEPFASLLFSEAKTRKLRGELGDLTDMIDEAIAHADRSTDDMNEQTQRLTDKLDELRGAADEYTDLLDGIINENVSTINELSARISDIIDRTRPFTEKLSQASDKLSEAVSKLSDAAKIVCDSGEDADKALTILRPGLDELSDSIGSLKDGMGHVSESLAELKAAMGDPDRFAERAAETEAALSELMERFDAISMASGDLVDALVEGGEIGRERVRNVANALAELRDSSGNISNHIRNIRDRLHSLAATLRSGGELDIREEFSGLISEFAHFSDIDGFADGFADLLDSMAELIDEDAALRIYDASVRLSDELKAVDPDTDTSRLSEDRQHIEESARHIYASVDELILAGADADGSGVKMQEFIGTVSEAWDLLDSSETSLLDAAEYAKDALDLGGEGGTLITEALEVLRDINGYLSGKAKLVFTGAGSDIINARDRIGSLSSDMLDIFNSLAGTGSGSADVLTDDLVKINSKLSEVYGTLIDMAEDIGGSDIEDYTEDVSEEDSVGRSDGKTASCTNTGYICGDVSVGGIAGTMAVENALDPEDDLKVSGERSTDFVYKTKTVLRDCVNFGDVRCKRSYAGGITGSMAAGAVISCRSRCTVTSDEGSYVGGVAGESKSSVISSTAECRLSGRDYVGGITGSGHTVYDCLAITDLAGFHDFYGAVAGDADDLRNDRFVENGFGGVNDMSYEGKAYPVTFGEMAGADDIPDDMKTLALKFVVRDDDGKITQTAGIINIPYGEDADPSQFPEVPAKSGSSGRWEDFDMKCIVCDKTIDAVYTKLLTTIASDVTDENGLARLLAEGSFTDADHIDMVQSGAAWDVSMPDEEEHLIRYMPGSDPDRTDIYINGNKVQTVTDGRYLTFEASGRFILTESERPADMRVWIIAGAAVLLAAVTVIIVMARRKHKK